MWVVFLSYISRPRIRTTNGKTILPAHLRLLVPILNLFLECTNYARVCRKSHSLRHRSILSLSLPKRLSLVKKENTRVHHSHSINHTNASKGRSQTVPALSNDGVSW